MKTLSPASYTNSYLVKQACYVCAFPWKIGWGPPTPWCPETSGPACWHSQLAFLLPVRTRDITMMKNYLLKQLLFDATWKWSVDVTLCHTHMLYGPPTQILPWATPPCSPRSRCLLRCPGWADGSGGLCGSAWTRLCSGHTSAPTAAKSTQMITDEHVKNKVRPSWGRRPTTLCWSLWLCD